MSSPSEGQAKRGAGRARRTGQAAWPVEVFAVDDVSVQLTWRASPAEGLELAVGDHVVEPVPSVKAALLLDAKGAARYRNELRRRPGASGAMGAAALPGPALLNRYRNGWRTLDRAWPAGPGAVTIEGLKPGQTYEVVGRAGGVPEHVVARFTTLVPPPGRELARFATVSDVHIGESHFGVLGRLYDPHYLEHNGDEGRHYPFRALRAAIDETAAWGAQALVVKGDLTHKTRPVELREVARLLATSPMAVEAVLGNHDIGRARANVRGMLAAEGLDVSWGPRARDLAGARLVLVDSVHSDPGRHGGEIAASMASQIADLAAAAPHCAWVAMHHPPEMHRYPLAYPPGIPFGQSRKLLDALAATGTPIMMSCGHRHRNRRYRYGPVEITEVGSTKDYPGVWAGYKVFEGGLLQVVRRVASPDVITWTENTRRAVNGQWGRWSPGRLDDRCFSWSWPA